MIKNTTAQNVDPDRVEMASGYRMKTRPAPGRNIKGLAGTLGRSGRWEEGLVRLHWPQASLWLWVSEKPRI